MYWLMLRKVIFPMMNEIVILSVLFLLCIIVCVRLIGGRDKRIHSDSKELMCCVHEFFESEFEILKPTSPYYVSQVWERTNRGTGLSISTIRTVIRGT